MTQVFKEMKNNTCKFMMLWLRADLGWKFLGLSFNSELYGRNTINVGSGGRSDCCVVIFASFKKKVSDGTSNAALKLHNPLGYTFCSKV